MDLILSCCTPIIEKQNIPIEILISVIFQNISYTSSKNYQKWFYNNYVNHKTPKRERTYSLDSEQDFDSFLTFRKSESMETIFEDMFDIHIDEYYSPIYKEFIGFFEKNLYYFPKKIESINFNFYGKSKIKYFEKFNNLFISFVFPKNIVLSPDEIKIKKFKFSKTLIELWETLNNNYYSSQLIEEMNKYDNIYFVSHYKNCLMTDFIIYQLIKKYHLKIHYTSILPDFLENKLFYQKLKTKINYYVFTDEYNKYNFDNFFRLECKTPCFCNRTNYRKNLKNISIKLLNLFH